MDRRMSFCSRSLGRKLSLALLSLIIAAPSLAADKVVNLYTARHYDSDEAIYRAFTAKTGIAVNRIEASADLLVERLKAEGANSPADVVMTVDAGRLGLLEREDLLQPIDSAVLRATIPANLRQPDGKWFAFSTRVRVFIYDKARIDPRSIQTYESLADPKLKGEICIRSSSNIYNLSMMAALIARLGEPAAENWARGVVANFARAPQGGDTDQIKAVAAGECGVAVANTYYFVRFLVSQKPEDQALAAKLGVVFPNQEASGAHVNVSGAGVAKHAPNRANAIAFLEFLASDEAQRIFADSNNEYPAVASVPANAALAGLGAFKADAVNVAVLGANQAPAQKIFDRAGWK
jgi:iron(III) transport system substrate-binding protein